MSITKPPKPAPQIGQIYLYLCKDPYCEGPSKRRIEIVDVSPDYVRAKVLCDDFGKPSNRTTTMMIKTLRAGYRLCES